MPSRPLPAHPGATSPSPPGSDHHASYADEYDADLLARAPELTREQRQAGYDTGLLSAAAGRTQPPPAPGGLLRTDSDPPTSPLYGGGFSPMNVSPGHGHRGSSTEKLDPNSRMSVPAGYGVAEERAVYSPVDRPHRDRGGVPSSGRRGDGRTGGATGPAASAAAVMGATEAAEYEKRGGHQRGMATQSSSSRRPWYRRPIGFVLIAAALVVLVIVIAVPVAVTHKSSSNKSSSGSSGQSTPPGDSGATQTQSTLSDNGSGVGTNTTSGNFVPPNGPSSSTSSTPRGIGGGGDGTSPTTGDPTGPVASLIPRAPAPTAAPAPLWL